MHAVAHAPVPPLRDASRLPGTPPSAALALALYRGIERLRGLLRRS